MHGLKLGTAVLGGAAAAAGGYVALVTGRLTVDVGIGRRTRLLGPIMVDIHAACALAYAAASAPYAERRTRAMRDKVEILERTDKMVLAAHHTPLTWGLTAITVETVRFDPPERISFRLLRGPVPHVTETFTFEETDSGCRLRYVGELGTDLGFFGAAWGDVVARKWVATVRSSLQDVKAEAERRATKP